MLGGCVPALNPSFFYEHINPNDMLHDELEYRGHQIKIYYDTDPLNPREWCEYMGNMICFHSRYKLGDDHAYADPDDFREVHEDEDIISLPLYLYDHGGITMSTGAFGCPWDSGQVGVIYASYKEILHWFDEEEMTEELKAKAIKCLEAEVEEYDDYLRGNVYNYVVEGRACDDAVGNYHGDPEKSGLIEDAKAAIDAGIIYETNKHCEKLKSYIRAGVELIYRKPCMVAV